MPLPILLFYPIQITREKGEGRGKRERG